MKTVKVLEVYLVKGRGTVAVINGPDFPIYIGDIIGKYKIKGIEHRNMMDGSVSMNKTIGLLLDGHPQQGDVLEWKSGKTNE